jgi:hypothetical protein
MADIGAATRGRAMDLTRYFRMYTAGKSTTAGSKKTRALIPC